MRRPASLPCLLLTLTALASCGADTQPAREAGRPLVVGFSQLSSRSPWSRASIRSIQEAAHTAGITLEYADGENRQQNQVNELRSFIRQRVDVIVLSPMVETGWDMVLDEARAAKIPVVLVDRSIEVSDDSLYVTRVGSDFVEEGRRAGRWLIEHMKSEPGEIGIAELQGTVGSTPANDRKLGFAEAIAIDPRFRIIRSQSGDFNRSYGKLVMERFLAAEGRRIRVLFAHNDEMALGAVEAIEDAGMKPGTDVLVISIDATHQAFEAMAAGKINVTVECSPLLGPPLVETLQRVASGQPVPRNILTAETVFPRETASREMAGRPY